MTDSEDYPLMTVGELARVRGVPRELLGDSEADEVTWLLENAGLET